MRRLREEQAGVPDLLGEVVAAVAGLGKLPTGAGGRKRKGGPGGDPVGGGEEVGVGANYGPEEGEGDTTL